MRRLSTAARLFLTVWLVYAAFATTNVVRETYLAVALGDRGSVRVDPFLGLHPDLFAIPGRGAYINSNPGASLLGAVPYALSRPAVAGLFALRPGLAATDFPMISPRQPAQSYLLQKLVRTADGDALHAIHGVAMPPGEPLPHEDIVDITWWISEGAKI